MNPQLLEEIDYTHIVTEDDTPVDNFQSEKQQRLLVEPLYSSWQPGVPFIAAANVGLFYALKQDPLVPDAFLSLGVTMPEDWSKKRNRSYFAWEIGKFPEVVIEIVSNKKGDELGDKKNEYARMGIACYAVFDPLEQLQGKDELNGSLLKVWALQQKKYVELPVPSWLESVELGLRLWEGTFEGRQDLWLRWCDRDGNVIPTGAERAIEAEERATEAEERATEVEERATEAEERATEAEERATEAEERATEAQQKAQKLAERLRAMGLNPDEI